MIFCPNLKNKVVGKEFKKLTDVLGEDLAYLLWDKTNGEGVLYDEQGNLLKSYKKVLDRANGDEESAIIAIAETIINGTPDTELKTGKFLNYYDYQKVYIEKFMPKIRMNLNNSEINDVEDQITFNRISDLLGVEAADSFRNYVYENIDDLSNKAFSISVDKNNLPDYSKDVHADKIAELARIWLNTEYFNNILPEQLQTLRNRWIDSGKVISYPEMFISNIINSIKHSDINEYDQTTQDIINNACATAYGTLFNVIKQKSQRFGKLKHDVSDKESKFYKSLLAAIKQHNVNIFITKRAYDERLRLQLEYKANSDLHKQFINYLSKSLANYYSARQRKQEWSTITSPTKMSLKRALALIGTDPLYKDLCERLSKMSGDIEIIFDKLEGSKLGEHSYIKNKNSEKISIIAIDVYKTRLNPREQIHAILHETIHAATVNYLSDHKELSQKLKKYVDYIVDVNSDSLFYATMDTYGFENEREFIAEFFTNPMFRESLKYMEPMESKEFKSLFHQIVDFILSLFGYKDKSSSVYDQINPVMEYILDEGISYGSLVQYDPARLVGLELVRSNLQAQKSTIKSSIDRLVSTYKRKTKTTTLDEDVKQHLFFLQCKLKSLDDTESKIEVLRVFVEDVIGDIKTPKSWSGKYLEKIQQWENDTNFEHVTPSDIVDVYENVICILNMFIGDSGVIRKPEIEFNEKAEKNFNSLRDAKDKIYDVWAHATHEVGSRIVDDFVDNYADAVAEDREGMKQVTKDWLFNSIMFNDFGDVVAFLYNYANSPNPVIKQVFHLIQTKESLTEQEFAELIRPIERLMHKHDSMFSRKKHNVAKLIAEKDANGQFTGYYVTEVNRGECERVVKLRTEQFRNKFMEDHKFTNSFGDTVYPFYMQEDGKWLLVQKVVDKNGDTTFIREDAFSHRTSQWVPVGGSYSWSPTDAPLFVQYMLGIEKIKSEEYDRRYTFDYYSERLSPPYHEKYCPDGHGLSPDTLAKYNEIQSEINFYYDLATGKDGVCRPEDLSPENKEKLRRYKEELEDLSNPYIIPSNYAQGQTGILKSGDDYRMACEICAWQKFINDKIEQSFDLDAFEEALQEATKKGNQDAFLEFNGSFSISPEYYEYITEQVANDVYNELKAAAARINTICAFTFDQVLRAVQTRYESKDKSFKKAFGRLFKTNDMFNPKLTKFYTNIEYLMEAKRLDEQSAKSSNATMETIGGISIGVEWSKHFDNYQIPYTTGSGYERVIIDDDGYISIDDTDPSKDIKPEERATYLDKALCYFEGLINDPEHSLGVGCLEGIYDERGEPMNIINVADKQYARFSNKGLRIQQWIYDNILTYKYTCKSGPDAGTTFKKPLTMFCGRKPAKDTFTWKGKEVPSVCWTPTTSRFKHKYNAKDASFLNSDYDFSKQDQVQPKFIKYRNSDYDTMLNDSYAKSLHDSIFDIMKYCWDIYFPGQPYLGKMPQIEASPGAQLSRLFSNGLQATSQQLISNMTDVQAKDDVIRTKDRIVNPDGSYANEVLQKYVGKINDPQMISIDHFNAVAHFLMAALSYKNKKDIQDTIKAIRMSLDPNIRSEYFEKFGQKEGQFKPEENKNSVKVFDTMVDTHLYDTKSDFIESEDDSIGTGEDKNKVRPLMVGAFATAGSASALAPVAFLGFTTLSVFGVAVPITAATLITSAAFGIVTGAAAAFTTYYQKKNGQSAGAGKYSRLFITATALQLLGFNLLSAMTGAFDSTITLIRVALEGTGINIKDLTSSFYHVVTNLPKMLQNIKNPVANNKITEMMKKSGVSIDFKSRFSDGLNSRTYRVLTELPMAVYRLGDYFTSSCLLTSMYMNTKLFDPEKLDIINTTVPAGFYTKNQLITKLMDDGFLKKDAIAIYNRCNVSLYDAIDEKAQPKDEYKHLITQDNFDRCRSYSKFRQALINGTNPDNDKAPWRNSPWASAVMLFRGFLLQNLQEKFAGGIDNIPRRFKRTEEPETTGTNTKLVPKVSVIPFTKQEQERRFAYNYELGHTQPETFKALYRACGAILEYVINPIVNTFRNKKSETRKLSAVEVNALKRLFIFCLSILVQTVAVKQFHDFATDNITLPQKVHYYKNRDVKGPKDVFNAVDWVNYWKYAAENRHYLAIIDDVLFRTHTSQLSTFNISDAESIITCATVLQSGYNQLLGTSRATQELLEIDDLGNRKGNQIITHGGYAGQTRKARDLAKTFGWLNNTHTSLTLAGVQANYNFNRKTFNPILNRIIGKKDETKPIIKKSKPNRNDGYDLGMSNTGGFDLGTTNNSQGFDLE